MSIVFRAATFADAQTLCDVINPIIEKGGSTAHSKIFTRDRMIRDYFEKPTQISLTVADDDGLILGFQSLATATELKPNMAGQPEDWGIIATFVGMAAHGKGVGQKLFAQTLEAARNARLKSIDATIRRYNTGGLAYYSKIGFVDYRSNDLSISKRYDL